MKNVDVMVIEGSVRLSSQVSRKEEACNSPEEMGTHLALTASPVASQLVNAIELAVKTMREEMLTKYEGETEQDMVDVVAVLTE